MICPFCTKDNFNLSKFKIPFASKKVELCTACINLIEMDYPRHRHMDKLNEIWKQQR